MAMMVGEHKPVSADELIRLRDRLLRDAYEAQEKNMVFTVRHRAAIDLDHLSRLLDDATGTKRMEFWVNVKPNKKGNLRRAAKPKTRTAKK